MKTPIVVYYQKISIHTSEVFSYNDGIRKKALRFLFIKGRLARQKGKLFPLRYVYREEYENNLKKDGVPIVPEDL